MPKSGAAVAALSEETFGAELDAAGIAKWFGYDSPNEMVRGLTVGNAPSLPPDASAAQLSDVLAQSQPRNPVVHNHTVTVGWTPPRPAPSPAADGAVAAGEEKPVQRQNQGGTCAQVKLQIEQEAVLTRKAVGATLEIFNEADVPLEELNVTINIYDPQGELANDKFVILAPEPTELPVSRVRPRMKWTPTSTSAARSGSRPPRAPAAPAGSSCRWTTRRRMSRWFIRWAARSVTWRAECRRPRCWCRGR